MENYLGEIRVFPYDRIPRGWLLCDGQILQINSYSSLFSLIGSKFGGDGRYTFALPNLCGRLMMGIGSNGESNYAMGNSGGTEAALLEINHMPSHNHSVNVNLSYDLALPSTNFLGNPNVQTNPNQKQKNLGNVNLYVEADSVSKVTSLHPESISSTGVSAPHENRIPFLSLKYCIAVQGNWPPQS